MMTNWRQRLVGWVGVLLLLGVVPVHATEDGPSILREFIVRHQLPVEAEELTVRLVDRLGHTKMRKLRRYSRAWEDGGSRHLLVVDAPPAVAGTALLAWQVPGKPGQYWSYLPAQGVVQSQKSRPGSGQTYFMGTDLTYEDIAVEDLEKYTYERMPDAKLGKQEVFVVRALPGNNAVARASGYMHRDLYLDRQDYALLRIDYFDRRGRLLKKLTMEGGSTRVGKRGRRFNKWVIENVQAKHRTELNVQRREVAGAKVSPQLFSVQYLSAGQHLRRVGAP